MLQVNVDDLIRGLGFLKDIVPSAPHNPIFKNVLVSPEGDTLTLRGADSGKAGYIQIPCEFSEGVPEFLVEMSKLYDFIVIARKTNDVLRFEVGNSLKVLLEDDSVTTFSLTDADAFPYMMEINNEVVFEVEPRKFVKAMNMSLFTDPKLVRLSALHIFSRNGKLMVESTSKFTGGIVTVQETDADFNISVVATIEKPLGRQLKSSDEHWTIKVSDRHIFVEASDWTIAYSLVTVPYFDIGGMYQNENVNRLSLNREEFTQHINLISAVVGDDDLHLTVKDGRIDLYSKESNSPNKRESSILIEEGEKQNKVILSLGELKKLMSVLEEEFFWMQIGSNIEPILIYENNERMYFTLQSNK